MGGMYMYKIVLCDDERRSLNLLSKIIDYSAIGFEVVATFTRGKELVDYLKDNHLDSVITDIKMPGMTLEECAKRTIKAMKRNELFIITHGEYAPYCKKRFDRIMAAFAETSPSPEYDPSQPLQGTREWANND